MIKLCPDKFIEIQFTQQVTSLTLTRPIGSPPNASVAQKIADHR